MTAEPVISNLAKADLKSIWKEIARGRDSVTADRMTATIMDLCRSDALFPETGQARDDLAGVRSFPVSPYVVFFRPADDTIKVIRVLHGRRDIRRIMKRKR